MVICVQCQEGYMPGGDTGHKSLALILRDRPVPPTQDLLVQSRKGFDYAHLLALVLLAFSPYERPAQYPMMPVEQYGDDEPEEQCDPMVEMIIQILAQEKDIQATYTAQGGPEEEDRKSEERKIEILRKRIASHLEELKNSNAFSKADDTDADVHRNLFMSLLLTMCKMQTVHEYLLSHNSGRLTKAEQALAAGAHCVAVRMVSRLGGMFVDGIQDEEKREVASRTIGDSLLRGMGMGLVGLTGLVGLLGLKQAGLNKEVLQLKAITGVQSQALPLLPQENATATGLHDETTQTNEGNKPTSLQARKQAFAKAVTTLLPAHLMSEHGSLAQQAHNALRHDWAHEAKLFARRNDTVYTSLLSLLLQPAEGQREKWIKKSSDTWKKWDNRWDLQRFCIANMDKMIEGERKDESHYVRTILEFLSESSQIKEFKEFRLVPRYRADNFSVLADGVISPLVIQIFRPFIDFLKNKQIHKQPLEKDIDIDRPNYNFMETYGLYFGGMFTAASDTIHGMLLNSADSSLLGKLLPTGTATKAMAVLAALMGAGGPSLVVLAHRFTPFDGHRF